MKNIGSILLGGGNFWITEAVYKNLKGVLRVTPGYAGGDLQNPSYLEVCSGKTGHAEVAQVYFDPKQIDLESILQIFFEMHNPTLINKQGVEKGSQYRSYIGCESLQQSKKVKAFIKELPDRNTYDEPICTEVAMNKTFFEAAYFHHNYYEIQREQPYASRLIAPILNRVETKYKNYYTTPLLAS
jgi:peptide-methionine (S)-S-oxide reductase